MCGCARRRDRVWAVWLKFVKFKCIGEREGEGERVQERGRERKRAKPFCAVSD